ncbi:MAG: hypothetical protein RL021_392 [Bacteroidota bacterium]|jgi:hypothetical protein
MKRPLLLLIVLLVSQFIYGQKKSEPVEAPDMPVDEVTHLITYEGVNSVAGTSSSELYKRMQDWFKTYYKNPSEVIRENDSVKFTMTGKPRFRIQNLPDKNGIRTDAGNIQYTIMVAAKDGRFRYELTEFNWKQASYYPCEKWMDTSAVSWTPVYNEYLRQLDSTAEQIITSLQDFLSTAKAEKNRNDW